MKEVDQAHEVRVLIRDSKEFQRYFNYFKATIIACEMSVTPDLIVNAYMTPFGTVTALETTN